MNEILENIHQNSSDDQSHSFVNVNDIKEVKWNTPYKSKLSEVTTYTHKKQNVENIVFFKLTDGLIIIGWLHRPREWLKSAKSCARLPSAEHLADADGQAPPA